MFRRYIVLSAASLICASAQIALADDNRAVAGAVERSVTGNDMTYHRHYHHGYPEHRHYAEHQRYQHTYVQ
jgi:hypothetical protein